MIDWTQARALREEVGVEDFGEVVELFLEEVEEVIQRLQENLDISTLEADMHFLKGSALSLGFAAFSKLCQEGESLSAQGRNGDVDVGSVLASYASSKTQFLSEFDAAFS